MDGRDYDITYTGGLPLRSPAAVTRERAMAAYQAGEEQMTRAAAQLAGLGVHAASPAQLRRQVSEYLARLAAIARSGAERPDEVLALAAGDRSGVSWG